MFYVCAEASNHVLREVECLTKRVDGGACYCLSAFVKGPSSLKWVKYKIQHDQVQNTGYRLQHPLAACTAHRLRVEYVHTPSLSGADMHRAVACDNCQLVVRPHGKYSFPLSGPEGFVLSSICKYGHCTYTP